MSLRHSLLDLISYIISRLVCKYVCYFVLVMLQHLNTAQQLAIYTSATEHTNVTLICLQGSANCHDKILYHCNLSFSLPQNFVWFAVMP